MFVAQTWKQAEYCFRLAADITSRFFNTTISVPNRMIVFDDVDRVLRFVALEDVHRGRGLNGEIIFDHHVYDDLPFIASSGISKDKYYAYLDEWEAIQNYNSTKDN